MQGLEKYLMTKIYHKVFAVSELDRERDESLTMRMSALGFIEPKHLDIPETYHDEKSWILARKELHKINNYKVRILFGGLQHYRGLWSAPLSSLETACGFASVVKHVQVCQALPLHVGTTRQACLRSQLLPGYQQSSACPSARRGKR